MSHVPADRTTIDTQSGRRIDFAAPDPAEICIEDIAAGLAKVCRFGGQATAFYSVAQHAVLVRRLVIERGRHDLGLVALHHDSHEAYACDIPKPLKHLLPSYVEVADRLDAAINEALELPAPSHDDIAVVKGADDEAFEIESAHLRNRDGALGNPPPQISDLIVSGKAWPIWSVAVARCEFLKAHSEARSAVHNTS